MFKLIKRLWMNLMLLVFADLTTAVATGSGLSKLSEAIRLVYSREIEFRAMPIMRFFQFATIKTELGISPGLTVNMLVYDNLSLGGGLTEGTQMATEALSGSLKSITVTEYGKAIKVSQLLLTSSFDDVMDSATILLSRDYAKVLDCSLRDAALSGTNHIYARTSAGAVVSARTGLDSSCTFKVSTVKDSIEVLATNNTPKVEGANYICFLHPHQSRGLRDDPAWINASNYGSPDQLFTGEIGRIDDTRFIETTLMCNGAAAVTDPAYKAALVSGTAGNAVHVYQAVIFGADYYGLAIALPVEIRDNGVIDFGRERGLAWYSIWGTGKLHDEYGVVIETA